MATKKCPVCGRNYIGEFCPTCHPELVEKRELPPGAKDPELYKNMVRCSNCGKKLRNDMDYCPNCGTKKVIPVYAPRICSNCGLELEKGQKFCYKCGTKFEAFIDSEENSEEEKTGGISLAGLIIILLVIAALVFAGIKFGPAVIATIKNLL